MESPATTVEEKVGEAFGERKREERAVRRHLLEELFVESSESEGEGLEDIRMGGFNGRGEGKRESEGKRKTNAGKKQMQSRQSKQSKQTSNEVSD